MIMSVQVVCCIRNCEFIYHAYILPQSFASSVNTACQAPKRRVTRYIFS